ncbi:MocR-like pyridoxine biosynthesis transcription factor PdxR [Streptomyces sp. NPDC054796]
MNRSNGSCPEGSISAGSDFLQLDTGEAPVGGLADWLTGRLRLALADGRLPVGSRLPATRVLAAELRVSRGVVTEAYQRLAEAGQVEGRGRGGTVVVAVPAPPIPPALALRPPPLPPDSGPRPGGRAGEGGAAGALFAAAPAADVFDTLRAAPARIDLSPGLPDLTVFPRTRWMRAERAVLRDLPASALGYVDPRGAPELRHAVAAWLARNRGIVVPADEVVITAGTTQALALLGQVFRDRGITRVAVEEPGSLGVRQLLRGHRLETPPVAVDADGVRVDELRATGAPAVLLTPAHQFPTGVVLDGARRRALMRWATHEGGLVVEDDYDAEHRYDRPPVPALRSVLPEHVCYAGSVSKLLAPALRVGWVLVPSTYRDALIAAKRFADQGNAALPQLVLAALMESGELERQLRLLRGRHRRRRDAMIEAIRAHLPDATVHGAAAGLHLTVTFDGVFPDTGLAAAALARGVKTQPLSWHSQCPRRPGLVLGYAACTTASLHEGIAELRAALREVR